MTLSTWWTVLMRKALVLEQRYTSMLVTFSANLLNCKLHYIPKTQFIIFLRKSHATIKAKLALVETNTTSVFTEIRKSSLTVTKKMKHWLHGESEVHQIVHNPTQSVHFRLNWIPEVIIPYHVQDLLGNEDTPSRWNHPIGDCDCIREGGAWFHGHDAMARHI